MKTKPLRAKLNKPRGEEDRRTISIHVEVLRLLGIDPDKDVQIGGLINKMGIEITSAPDQCCEECR